MNAIAFANSFLELLSVFKKLSRNSPLNRLTDFCWLFQIYLTKFLHYEVFNVHAALSRQLIYNTTLWYYCQVLFWTFFKVFRTFFFHAPSLQTVHKKTGNVLLSQAASHQVSSALKSLTSVFEMGTGVASPLLSPDLIWRMYLQNWISISCMKTIGQVFDLLVSVSWMHYCTYTSDLSTW